MAEDRTAVLDTVAAPTLDRAFARWCLTVESDR